MDLGELQVFLMVAKEGSFSRAAERLYRTQPAVSLAIRKLEDSLGQPLFIRGARPVRLTDAGTLLREYAERLLNLRDEVKKGLSELQGLERGELSLGVNESSIHALLPALGNRARLDERSQDTTVEYAASCLPGVAARSKAAPCCRRAHANPQTRVKQN